LVELIDLLKKAPGPCTIKNLTDQLGISITMVYRIVSTLVQAGMVENVGSTVTKVSIREMYRHAGHDDLMKLVAAIPRLHP
jgi:DNA-binding IclR family transcriptional regulator